MKLYEKIINNQYYCIPLSKIVLIKDEMQIFNPTEEMVIEDGWIEHIPRVINPTEEELLKQEINNKLEQLTIYDESDKVNDCIIVYKANRLHFWANKVERDTLKGAVQDFINLGRTEYRLDLRELGVSLTVPCSMLLNMMSQLEVYAADCYNKTTDHQFAIKQLTSIEEVINYDFTVGYPEKLNFILDNI